MCIIILKPKGIAVSDEIMRNCWDANPHGGGLAFADTACVQINKGFQNVDEMISLGKRLIDADVIYHFRIATSGKDPKWIQSQPLPLCSSLQTMEETFWRGEYAFAHNGIISGIGDADYSDSLYMCQIINATIGDKQGIIDAYSLKRVKTLIDMVAKGNSSRFVLMDKDGHFHTFGNGWQEHPDVKGLWFSGGSWKKGIFPTYTDMWSIYDDELEEYEYFCGSANICDLIAADCKRCVERKWIKHHINKCKKVARTMDGTDCHLCGKTCYIHTLQEKYNNVIKEREEAMEIICNNRKKKPKQMVFTDWSQYEDNQYYKGGY